MPGVWVEVLEVRAPMIKRLMTNTKQRQETVGGPLFTQDEKT
uniref:Uncharacterized protein n=1 Tax=Cucumis melo TaxID=3656 RepID=A0A9I9E406_CUCME